MFALPQQDEGICDEVFQIPEKFHVTLGVMRLFSTEEEVGICCVHNNMVQKIFTIHGPFTIGESHKGDERVLSGVNVSHQYGIITSHGL